MSDADVRAAVKEYRRFHWGRAGTDGVQRLIAGDPRQPLTAIGQLVCVVYRTRKGKAGVLTDYHHDFNERELPILAYERRTRLLVITGGTYDVKARGIID